MHSTATVALIVLTSTLPVLAGQVDPAPQSRLQQKLAELRQYRETQYYRNRVAVIPFRNETSKAGAEDSFTDAAVLIFQGRNYHVVPVHEVTAALERHPKGTLLSPEELARLAQILKVETIFMGTIKKFEAKRKFGVPLPTMWIKTQAKVTLEGAVYRRSANQIVWQDSDIRHDTALIGGGFVSRSEIRSRTGRDSLESLLDGYFSAKDAVRR